MEKLQEETSAPLEGGTGEHERGAENRKSTAQALEQSPKEQIAGTIQEIDKIDQEISTTRKSIAETRSKLAALREEMAMPADGEESPAAAFQNERIQKLEEQRKELDGKKSQWIEQYGQENLPEGIVMDDGNDGRETKGWSRGKNEERGQADNEKKEDLESRKQWVKKWEEETIEEFETAMKGDWRTKDALNLKSSIELMKLRAQISMEKAFADFLDGKIDMPPFSSMSLKWQTPSLFDKIAGKQSMISKLEIVFDKNPETLAEKNELSEEDEQSDAEGQKEPKLGGNVGQTAR